MSLKLDLVSTDLAPEDLDRFTRDLNAALNDSGALESQLETAPAEEGARGAWTAVGALVLEVLKSSAAGALIETLGAYFNREKSVSGKITFADGTTVEVNAKNLASGEFETTLAALVTKASG